MLLPDKVVIVSGLGPGLGQQLARGAVREGARVVLAARTASYLEQLQAELAADGGRSLAVPTDISDTGQCARLAESALAEFGRIDALINSAYTPGGLVPFRDADLETWRLPMDVNLFGSLALTQAVVPQLEAQGGGAIVFVNTMVQKKPLPGQGAYATSKGALTAAAKMLATELGPLGIRVNSIYPGWMWGPPVEAYLRGVAQEQDVPLEEIVAGIASEIPLGGVPSDVDCANAALFLASDYARVITGASLDVNGGEWMP